MRGDLVAVVSDSGSGNRRLRTWPVAALLQIFILLSVLSAMHESLTYDEDLHFQYGMQILALNSNRFNPSTMPVTALNAIPKSVSNQLPEGALRSILARFPTARMVTVLASLGLGLLCFHWASRINGYVPALLTLGLYVVEPNIIAHSQLVTTDLYAAAASGLTVYALWRFADKGGWGRGVVFGLALGLAQLAKFSCILLFPICVTVHVIYLSPSWIESAKGRRYRELSRQVGSFLLQWLGFGLLSTLVVNAGFFFNGTLTRLADYSFYSSQFQSIQQALPQLSNLPAPLPRPYLVKLDQVVYSERTANEGLASFYLLGNLNHEGFIGYYLVAFLFKVPLVVQAIALLSLIMYLRSFSTERFLKKELFVLVPIVFFVIYFNLFNRFSKGIRHYLVVFPFVLVFCSTVMAGWRTWPRWKWVTLSVSLGLLLASVVSYFPHYLSYFNELVPDRRFAYRILADPNPDWGQDQWYLARFQEEHPNAHISPGEPVTGTVVVGVNELLGILGSPDTYGWLRCCYRPVGTVAYSYLIFEVPADAGAGPS